MATISASDVKSLRDRTGAGMMDCKKALQDTGGDEEKAIDLLRKWGAAKAARRSERETTEGLVHVTEREGAYAMVAVTSETDFVARNDEFRDFAERLAARVIESDDLPSGETIEGEALLERDRFAPFAAELTDLRARIGENIMVDRAVRLAPAEAGSAASYVHFGGKIGVLVELSAGGAEESAVEVAMHVAATDPIGVSPDDIPPEERERERALLAEQAASEGKPEAIVEKIVEGRMRKFYEQNALLLQPFVKDPDLTVQALLDDRKEGLTVRRFVRFQIGN